MRFCTKIESFAANIVLDLVYNEILRIVKVSSLNFLAHITIINK